MNQLYSDFLAAFSTLLEGHPDTSPEALASLNSLAATVRIHFLFKYLLLEESSENGRAQARGLLEELINEQPAAIEVSDTPTDYFAENFLRILNCAEEVPENVYPDKENVSGEQFPLSVREGEWNQELAVLTIAYFAETMHADIVANVDSIFTILLNLIRSSKNKAVREASASGVGLIMTYLGSVSQSGAYFTYWERCFSTLINSLQKEADGDVVIELIECLRSVVETTTIPDADAPKIVDFMTKQLRNGRFPDENILRSWWFLFGVLYDKYFHIVKDTADKIAIATCELLKAKQKTTLAYGLLFASKVSKCKVNPLKHGMTFVETAVKHVTSTELTVRNGSLHCLKSMASMVDYNDAVKSTFDDLFALDVIPAYATEALVIVCNCAVQSLEKELILSYIASLPQSMTKSNVNSFRAFVDYIRMRLEDTSAKDELILKLVNVIVHNDGEKDGTVTQVKAEMLDIVKQLKTTQPSFFHKMRKSLNRAKRNCLDKLIG